MKNFSKDKHALSIPWVESPFFYELLKNSNLSDKEKEMCINYHEKGYAIIDLNLSDNEIQQVVDDMYKALDNEKTKFHADHFQYTESRRIFELWKQSKPAAELCLNKKEIEMFDAVMEKGDPLAAFFAVRSLAYRYGDAIGVEGKMVTGTAPKSSKDQFRSQAEVVQAMSDPKYDNDPAYRQDIMQKLERSNVNF